MKKYAKVVNEETKEVSIAISENPDVSYFTKKGYTIEEIEMAYDGKWYLAGYAPVKPEPTIEEQNEAIRATREQLYIQASDKLKADYDEAVARCADNAEELKKAWLESKDKIREENPYIVESVEDDVTVEEVQIEDKTLPIEPEIGDDEAEPVEESEVIEDGLQREETEVVELYSMEI